MSLKIRLAISCIISCIAIQLTAKDVIWFDGHHAVTYYSIANPSPVVDIALDMFSHDMLAVTGKKAHAKKKAKIEIYQLDKVSNKEFKRITRYKLPYEQIITKPDAFYIGCHDGKLVVVGSNGRGTAYGILELSRMAGVSPWIWWGDVVPQKKRVLLTNEQFMTIQSPSVEYRGIFINDEDWSLRPWSEKTMEKGLAKGMIGPKTYRKIFELLLRLRANALWPAMHEGTTAFFNVKGNAQVADSFDIVLGSSHCEPMLRNNVGEWNQQQRGAYNYMTNREQVQNYWTERLKETKDMDAIYTLGMRGIHDGSMEGVKTLEEKTKGLQMVIDDQRKMLSTYVNKDLKAIPQVFIPYKEVLQIYDNGLRVPDDVMLMWCDDNYGYMTRLSDERQQKRSGGAGVYYHLSYWGRPHDYLWLTTAQPGLVYNELKTAYDHNARRLWIVNVHDPKVAAYDLSLVMDMAWNINSVKADKIQLHLYNWLVQQFGDIVAQKILPAMTKFYHLTGIRRPEFMGWSQVELDKQKYQRGLSPAGNTAFSAIDFGNERERYLEAFTEIKETVKEAESLLRPELKDAYFAAIKYPVFAASAMATKHLEAQESREIARKESFHRDDEALTSAVRSYNAFVEIQQLTSYYNNVMARGKWNGIMNMNPRDLPVFAPPTLPDRITEAEISKYNQKETIDSELRTDGCIARNACDFNGATIGVTPIEMLGHSMKAVSLPKDGEIIYKFDTTKSGNALIRIAAIPTQANDNGDIRFSVTLDDKSPVVFSLKEPFRSEQWKENVLRGQAVKSFKAHLGWGSHTLRIKALDNHIILDQWMIDYNPDRKFYMFPVKPAM
jgi:hypothetical protein